MPKLKILLLSIFILFISYISRVYAEDIIILHTNDTHGKIEATDTSIGFAQISSYVKELRDKNKYVLFFDAGDTFYDSPIVDLSEGEVVVDILNKIGIDALVPGNHDFNYGINRLFKIERRAKFPILAANVINSKGQNLFYSNFIKQVGDIKIGVFGLVTPETLYKTSSNNLKDVIFLNPIDVAKRQVTELKNNGADIVIAITHLGLDKNTKEYERSLPLTDIQDLDLVIDGHSHTVLPYGLIRNGITIAQTGAMGSHLGYITISIKPNNEGYTRDILAKLLSKEDFSKIKPDPAILKIIDKYKKKESKYLATKVTTLELPLDGEYNNVRTGETSLGMLLADSLKTATSADIALINSGSIRGSLNSGVITQNDILTVLPFDDQVVIVELSGQDILDILEQSVSNLPYPRSALLQSSGLKYKVNLSKPVGEKVSNVLINNVALNSKQIYKVATIDFLISGGDNYNEFHEKPIVNTHTYLHLTDVFIKYIEQQDLKNYDFTPRMVVSKN